jgi:hypothetical protein
MKMFIAVAMFAVYCIDSRGRQFVERYGLHQQLLDSSVSTQGMDLNMVNPTCRFSSTV